MLAFIVRRVLAGIILVAVVATTTFLLLYAGGGDVARNLLGPGADQATVDQKAAELGIDRPLLTQFADWVSGAVKGDLGTSWFSGQPVTDALTSRLPVTLSLVIGATLLTAVLATVLGVVAARRGGWADRLVLTLAILGFAVPGFLVALGLVTVFAVQLGWFQPTGYQQLTATPGGWLSSIALPVVALSVAAIAGVAAQVRGSIVDSLGQDYVRTLRSRGLSETRIVYKHVLRNAAGPALAVLAVQFVGMLGGAVIIEQIFAIPGVGQIGVVSTSQGDVPLVMGLVVVTAALVVALNLLVDLLQAWLNPRVRVS